MLNDKFMQKAFQKAEESLKFNEIPVGAVIASNDGKLLAATHNLCEREQNPTEHAEMLAIKEACKKIGKNLSECSIYITLEPCFMCAAAISNARISRLYFANFDHKSGGLDFYKSPSCHNKPEIYSPIEGSIIQKESQQLLQGFFHRLRQK